MLNKHFCISARTPMFVPPEAGCSLAVWHFYVLGLGAEGVGKLSRNKLSHAEALCLVA